MTKLHTFARNYTPRVIRNWLRMPSKSIEYVKDRLSFAVGNTKMVKVRENWILRVHPAAHHHFEVFNTDPIQSSELNAFIANCPNGIRLLDVGAHYGFFALAALRYGGAEAKVLCVEASPSAAKILDTTLNLNKTDGRVRVFNVAMGDKDGMLSMLATGPLGGDYFIVPTEERKDTIQVPQRSLVSLLTETGFKPTHIKFDIEGFEFEVIESGLTILKELRPVLFLELHGTALRARGKDPLAVIQMLREAGYSSFVEDGQELTAEAMAALGYNCRMICR